MFLLVLFMLLISCVVGRIRIPSDTTWANLAWGYANGGSDDVLNSKLVLLDTGK